MKSGVPNEKNFFPMGSLYCTCCAVCAAQRFLALGQPTSGDGIAYWIAISYWILCRSSYIDGADNQLCLAQSSSRRRDR